MAKIKGERILSEFSFTLNAALYDHGQYYKSLIVIATVLREI